MMDFDVRTAMLIIGMLYFLLPLIAWVVLAKQRSQGVALWCIGGVLMGVAAILTSLQGRMPTGLFLVLFPLSFYGSSLLRIQALRLELGMPWKMRWIMLSALGMMLMVNAIEYGLGDSVLRAQFASFTGAALLLYLASLAARIGREERSDNAKWIAWAYVLAALSLLNRVVALIGHTGEVGVPIEGLSAHLISLTMLLAAVVGHLGYIGLHLDRALRREIKTAADRARDEENRRLGEQIAQLDRSRSLGEMSASLGHELNQPLTAILTNAQVAKRGLLAGRFQTEQFSEFLDKIIQNTQRASQIIERIRGFIRPTVARCEPVDLNRTVHEVAELIAAEARSRQVKLLFAEPAAPALVAGDAIQLSQIILNVLRNAVEALQQVAHREIRIACTRADGRVILQIRDSGPGLAAEVLAQAGSPFFTTKPSGLGMGISISRSIARQHGGTLSIANAHENGAVVELNLPALPEGSS